MSAYFPNLNICNNTHQQISIFCKHHKSWSFHHHCKSTNVVFNDKIISNDMAAWWMFTFPPSFIIFLLNPWWLIVFPSSLYNSATVVKVTFNIAKLHQYSTTAQQVQNIASPQPDLDERHQLTEDQPYIHQTDIGCCRKLFHDTSKMLIYLIIYNTRLY